MSVKKKHGLGFRNMALILTLPLMRPWECLLISPNLFPYLLNRMWWPWKCTSQISHCIECNWPKVPGMLSEIHHHTGTTSQSLSIARSLLGQAGAFLGDVGLLWPVTLAQRLSISFVKTFFELHIGQRLLLLKIPSSLLQGGKTCIMVWWFPHSPLFLHLFPSRSISIINFLHI